VGIIIPEGMSSKIQTPCHPCLPMGTHSKMRPTLAPPKAGTKLLLLGHNMTTSSAAILALLLWGSTGVVHLVVNVWIEHGLLRVVCLRNLLFGLRRQELMLWLLLLLGRLRDMSLILCARLWLRVIRSALVLGRRILSGHDVDEEIEHVRLAQSGCDVAPLQSTTLVLLSMNPRAHGELCDKGLASLGEYYRSFGGDHLHFWVGLHNLLDARERKLVDLVVVVFRLEHRHDLLPVGVQDVAIVACAKALGDLNRDALVRVFDAKTSRNMGNKILTLPQWPLKVSGGGAWPCAAMPALAP